MENKTPASQENVKEEVHVIVTGLVQGVGFRAGTRYLAAEQGVKGFVRNLSDGSVEIVAQGLRRDLELFLSRLEAESFGRLDNMAVQYRQPGSLYNDFRIIH